MATGKKTGGRQKGSLNKTTVVSKKTLAELARDLTEEALNTLRDVMRVGQSDAARVAASNAILDRGYGRPPQFSTSDHAAFKRATELTDDELADIASRGSEGIAPPEERPSVTH